MDIKIAAIYLGLLVVGIHEASGSRENNDEREIIRELEVRKGLPNFFAKALDGGSVKVAYLGGSITAQEGWRVYSLEWFRTRFPRASFSEINAAIGGTGSDFAVFRLSDHVLRFGPDLVFVEFAVNDSNKPVERIVRSMEGIVHQIWQYNPGTDICFIYTIKEDFLEAEEMGHLPYSAATMEEIADKNGIPSINLGSEVCRLLRSQELIFKRDSREMNGVRVFSRDGVHPYPETGHKIYFGVLRRSFEKMIAGKQAGPEKHQMAKPLDADFFSKARMFGLDKAGLSRNWQTLDFKSHPSFARFARYLDKIWKAVPGESLSIRFSGDTIGFVDLMGPGSGRISIEIDGAVRDTVYRFDKYCVRWRMNYVLVDQLHDKEHEMVVRVLPDPFDKAAILAERDNVIDDPEEYKENNWYVAKIMINGNVILDP